MKVFSRIVGWGVAIAALFLAGTAQAAEGQLKGLMFGDYYYIVKGADKDQNGFQFRRIYLTYEMKWNKRFSGRLRFEMKDAGFGSGGKMEPFVKNAYLKYSKNGRSVCLGQSGTPLWSISEGLWGYRSVHKTVMDWNKIGSSTDTGISFKGKLDDAGKVNVHLMVGNGAGTGAETNNRKKVYSLIHLKPSKRIEATAGFEWEKGANDRDRMTFSGLVGSSSKEFTVALEGFLKISKNQAFGSDVQQRGLSMFGRVRLNEKTRLLGRVDLFDPSDQAGSDNEYLFIVGIDLMPHSKIHVIPNVVATAYPSGVESDVVPRVTLFYVF